LRGAWWAAVDAFGELCQPVRGGQRLVAEQSALVNLPEKYPMKTLIVALVASAFSIGAFAQASKPASMAAPMKAASASMAAPAPMAKASGAMAKPKMKKMKKAASAPA